MATKIRTSLTKALVYAAALDAAERSKRERGVKIMDDAANDAYHETFDRLFAAIGGPSGWIDLPRQ